VKRPPRADLGFVALGAASRLGPFIPRQRTCGDCIGMSVSCQKQTSPIGHFGRGDADKKAPDAAGASIEILEVRSVSRDGSRIEQIIEAQLEDVLVDTHVLNERSRCPSRD
jgi:hypothetical protein